MLVLWIALGLMVVYVEPELVKNVLIEGSYLPFFLLFLPTSFITLSIVMASSRRGLLFSLGLSSFLLLRAYQLGNVFNGILLLGIIIAIDRYFES